MLELAGLIIFGILAQWVAWKTKMPAILPLILIGLAVGPLATLVTGDGHKLIQPIWDGSTGLFPGESLFYFVSLAVSIILFEGGLTLRRTEVLNVGPVIIKLITVAATITFVGSGIAAHFVFGLPWPISFLFAALVIVTGPTVIMPILRHIPLKKDVSAILKWEGILIDPLGALVAVLVFEFISAGGGRHFTKEAFISFGKIVLFGFTFGFTFAHALAFSIKKNLIPKYLLNVFTLAAVLGVFVMADYLAHESGLLAVVIMGMVLGNLNLPNFKELLYFKESLSILLVSILFILLAANINIEDLLLVYNWQALLLFVLIVFILRPLGVFLSSMNSSLKFNEKLFISWVGPRGIVAAGVSSLFGLKLASQGVPGAQYITPLVFMIVLGSVLLNGTTARLFAKIVGVFLKNSQGILIIGASSISRLIGAYLKKNNRHVVLIDNNRNNVRKAKNLGLDALEGNVYSDDLANNIELNDVGYVMALTGNSDINSAAIERFQKHFGENGSFRLVSPEEMGDPENNPKEGLFSHTDDYIKLTEVARKYPQIQEVAINSQEHYSGLIEISKSDPEIIPLFVKDNEGDLSIIPSNSQEIEIDKEGFKLVYLGKTMATEEEEETTNLKKTVSKD